jgi:uncharacterized membrane protein
MKVLRAALVFVAIAAIVNVSIVAALPWLINRYVSHKIVTMSGGENIALAAPRADAGSRTVVRPSPDLLYTSCVFDVSGHSLRITAPVQESYVSVAGFAADTSVFFSLNDAQLQPDETGVKRFDLLLVRRGASHPVTNARVIEAPSDRGLILFRSLITDDADVPRLRSEFQLRQKCEPA